jgi:hypothetical protein
MLGTLVFIIVVVGVIALGVVVVIDVIKVVIVVYEVDGCDIEDAIVQHSLGFVIFICT